MRACCVTMKILVCIKQVPDLDAHLERNESLTWIREGASVGYRMNRYDEFAIEEAVRIRERISGTVIDAVSVGPGRVLSALKRSLEKGVDEVFHIPVDTAGHISAATVSWLIAEFARSRSYDLIVCGVMAEDDMQGIVGPMIAARLGIPSAVSILFEELNETGTAVTVECEVDAESRNRLILDLPCLLTVQTGINRPRYPSLSNVMRAKAKGIAVIDVSGDMTGLRTEINYGLAALPDAKKGIVLNGSREEKADALLKILHERSLL